MEYDGRKRPGVDEDNVRRSKNEGPRQEELEEHCCLMFDDEREGLRSKVRSSFCKSVKLLNRHWNQQSLSILSFGKMLPTFLHTASNTKTQPFLDICFQTKNYEKLTSYYYKIKPIKPAKYYLPNIKNVRTML